MHGFSDFVLTIRPSGIDHNQETATDNVFQRRPETHLASVRRVAMHEFETLIEGLRAAGVGVICADPPAGINAPDAVFPNNWFSTHEDGTVVIYPMAAASRRVERRIELRQLLSQEGFHIAEVIDWSEWEHEGLFLEGTGSLVLDRISQVAYASLSPRTAVQAVHRWCERFGYRPVIFNAVTELGHGTRTPIYHTNVMLSLGVDWAIVCLHAIHDHDERKRLRYSLLDSGRQLIEITIDQMRQFAANVLQLRSMASPDGETGQPAAGHWVIAMSATAHRALHPEQVQRLHAHSEIVRVEIPTIELCGGGSVRCMLAEIFLPRMP